MTFLELIAELRKLNLPTNQYAIFGSGPLAVRGIRDSKDLDIIASSVLWKELIKKYKPVEDRVIRIGNIEIFCDGKPYFDDSDILVLTAEIINDLPFVQLEYVIEWKTARGLEKDKTDLKLIDDFLENNC